MKKFSFIMALVLVLSMVAVGCGGGGKEAGGNTENAPKESAGAQQDAGAKKLVIGFSQTDNGNPWKVAQTKSIREEAKKRGYELVYTDAQGDTAKQLSDVEDMIARGVNYIILSPREFEGLAPALDAAKKAGIPVILVDRKAKGTAGQDYLTYIGSNFIEEGKRAGEWLAQVTGGKAKIVELTGTAGASVAIDRKAGFEQAIKPYKDMEIIASQTGNFSQAEGQKVMENLLQSYGDKITAVYAHNDGMAIGAINAIEAAGKVPGKDIIIVSVDGTKDALQAIIDGKMGATVECSPFFGPPAFDVIEKHAKGETIQPEIINKDNFFNKDNAAEFVNKAY
ncbi:ABC transporter substrate-binding protein [Ferviditalea candida]|uniref:ABC transporter substrate-binding protein n=1 Tax=Ferviditalea candida TaxID=3108399 RepID=A0ABU5ZIW6_9BACL|nr:ABC transporter substrate-binding protein [Paenibacillaceae bacterium T2]